MSVFVPLAMDPFVAFGQGCKTVEIRAAKSPVAAQVRKHKAGDPVRLRWGYGPHGLHGIREWKATLGRVWEAPRLMDLPKEALDGAALSGELGRYFDPEQPVLAFEAFTVQGGERQPFCPCWAGFLKDGAVCPCACHPADAKCGWAHRHDDQGRCEPSASQVPRRQKVPAGRGGA